MDWFLLFGMVGIGLIVVGFIGFKTYTDAVIKGQEKEIAALTTENKRLKAALNSRQRVSRSEAIKPDFNEW